jgi:hypothetical protein
MNRFGVGSDYKQTDMVGFGLNTKPHSLAPIVYLCEICGKSKANYNHVRCSKIKQRMFLNEKNR